MCMGGQNVPGGVRAERCVFDNCAWLWESLSVTNRRSSCNFRIQLDPSEIQQSQSHTHDHKIHAHHVAIFLFLPLSRALMFCLCCAGMLMYCKSPSRQKGQAGLAPKQTRRSTDVAR